MPQYTRLVLFTTITLMLWADDAGYVTGADNKLLLYDTVTTQEIIAGDVFFEIIDPEDLQYTYRLRPAKDFGATFNANFRLNKAHLVPTNPTNACGKIKNAAAIKGNVALIERGDCTFLSKTINVEKFGAKAAIITEAEGQENEIDYYIEMVRDTTGQDAKIPAGFLVGKSGRIILTRLRELKQLHAVINLPVNLTFVPPHRINHPPWLGW